MAQVFFPVLHFWRHCATKEYQHIIMWIGRPGQMKVVKSILSSILAPLPLLLVYVCSVPRAASRVEGNNPAVAERKEPPQLQAGQLQLEPVHQERGLS